MNLTREQIAELEAGRETDALVATEVMGWIYSDTWGQLVPSGHADPPIWSDWEWDIEELTYVKHPINMMSGVSYRGDKPYIPDYSINISASWKVAEKLKLSVLPLETGYFAGIYDLEIEYFDDDMGIIDGHFGGGYAGMRRIYSIADTAPLAICRAALLAVRDYPEISE